MPNFRQFFASQAATGTVRPAMPSGVDVSWLSRGIDSAANSMERLRQYNEQQAQRLAHDEAAVQTINAESRLSMRAQERLKQLQDGPGLAGATDTLLKEFDGWAKEEDAQASETAKPLLARQAAQLRAGLHAKVYQAETVARQQQVATDFSSGLDDDRRLVYADPSQFNAALARRLALANTLTIPEAARQDLAMKSRESLAAGAATSLAESAPQQLLDRAGGGDPEKAAAAVKNDPILSNLSPEALRSTLHLARTELSRRAAEGRFDVVSRTKDVQAMVMSGVAPPAGVAPTVEEYTRLHGASGPAMWQQEVGNYLQIGGAIQQMRTSSAAEREQILASQQPTAGAGFAGNAQMFDAVKQAKALVEKQIASDPAAYVLATSPRVQQAAQVMQQVLNDPKQPAADKVAVVDFFARTSEAEQLRLGVDVIRDDQTGNKMRGAKLLTNAQANAISDMFHDQQIGGANAATLVTQLEQQWGKYWPKVYGQLAADNKLPTAALIIPNMPNDASRSRMAQVSAMKPDELKGLVPPGDLKDLNEQLRSSFDEAQRTFTAQGASGNTTLVRVMEGAEKLATLYMSQGRSAKEAARQAYTETMGHRYQWGDTYRVPTQYDLKQVRLGAEAAIETLVKGGEAVVFAGQAPQKLTDDVLRARSMWITNSDESGLELRMRGADGGVYAVHGKNGAPVTLTWADLTTRAKSATVVDNTGEGTTEWMRRRQQELNPRR